MCYKTLDRKKCYIITYWLNVKMLTFYIYIVVYIDVKRNKLILCHKVLKPITNYISTYYNIFEGRFLT